MRIFGKIYRSRTEIIHISLSDLQSNQFATNINSKNNVTINKFMKYIIKNSKTQFKNELYIN